MDITQNNFKSNQAPIAPSFDGDLSQFLKPIAEKNAQNGASLSAPQNTQQEPFLSTMQIKQEPKRNLNEAEQIAHEQYLNNNPQAKKPDFNEILASILPPTQSTDPRVEPKYRNTGLAYFDKRENLDIADLFLAKKIGIDIQRAAELSAAQNNAADLNLNQKQLRASAGDDFKEMRQILAVLKQGDSIIENAKGNTGLLSGLSTKAANLTGKIYDTSSDLAAFNSNVNNYLNLISPILRKGQNSNEADKRMRENYAPNFASEKNARLRINEAQKALYQKLSENIESLKAKSEMMNAPIDLSPYEDILEKYKAKSEYLDKTKNGTKFNLDKYRKAGE